MKTIKNAESLFHAAPSGAGRTECVWLNQAAVDAQTQRSLW